MRLIEDTEEEVKVLANPIKDHLGTIHALVNSSGSIVEQYTYDAWGRVLSIKNGSGTTITKSAIGNRYLFTGREYSYSTGLYYYRARFYDPNTGRFIRKDPIGITGGLNEYSYCGSNPVNFVDPSGLCEEGFKVVFVAKTAPTKDSKYFVDHGFYDEVIPLVGSNDDLIEMAEKLVWQRGKKIKEISVSGHGRGAGVRTKPDYSEGLNLDEMSDGQIARLKACMVSAGGVYVSWGCGSGQHPDQLQKISNNFNVKAMGWKGTVVSPTKTIPWGKQRISGWTGTKPQAGP